MNLSTCSTVPDIGCAVPFVMRITAIALSFIGVTALFLIIAAGIKFTTSGGGKAVEEAKNMITYAVVGLIIVLASFFIVDLIAGLTGVTCILRFGFNCGL